MARIGDATGRTRVCFAVMVGVLRAGVGRGVVVVVEGREVIRVVVRWRRGRSWRKAFSGRGESGRGMAVDMMM